jgi:hypothetical protein
MLTSPACICTSCQQPLSPFTLESHYQGYSLLLAERGLVRPVYPHDRQAMLAQGRAMLALTAVHPWAIQRKTAAIATARW